jgi:hypothetical protein
MDVGSVDKYLPEHLGGCQNGSRPGVFHVNLLTMEQRYRLTVAPQCAFCPSSGIRHVLLSSICAARREFLGLNIAWLGAVKSGL